MRPINLYPNDENYPSPSFKAPVTAPDVDPDEGAVLVIGLNEAWIPVVEGALDQLMLPSTWAGTHDEKNLALNRAANLKMLVGAATVGEVGTPFWNEEDVDGADDEEFVDDQQWYGEIVIIDDRLTFVENIFILVVGGLIVYAGQPGAAIAFVPIARNFVVTVKTDPLGGIVRFLRDGAEIGRTDTYSAVDGAKDVPVIFDVPAPAARGLRALSDDPPPALWIELLEDNPHDLPSVSMSVVRGRLSEADFSPVSLRYNEDTDEVEYTPDGGVTWVPDPADDPRHSAKFAKPLQTGGDVRCNSAASMVKWIRDFITYEADVLSTGAEVVTLANIALSFFDILAPWALLVQGLIKLAGDIFGVGAITLNTSFTDEVYDTMLCIFFCGIEADGSVTAGDLEDIQAKINTDLLTVAAFVTNAILSAQGEMGLQNAGTLYDVEGDCDDCNCLFCYTWDFTIEDYAGDGWAVEPPYGQYAAGQGWQTTSGQGLILDLPMPSALEIQSVQWGGTAFGVGSPSGRAVLYTLAGSTVYSSNESGIGNPWTQDVQHIDTVDKLRFNPYGSSGADIYIQNVTIYSTLEIPEFAARAC